MQNAESLTWEQIREFLKGSETIEFQGQNPAELYNSARFWPWNSMVSLPLRNSRICSQVSDSAFCIRSCTRPRNALPFHIFRIILYWNQVLFQDHLVLDNSLT